VNKELRLSIAQRPLFIVFWSLFIHREKTLLRTAVGKVKKHDSLG